MIVAGLEPARTIRSKKDHLWRGPVNDVNGGEGYFFNKSANDFQGKLACCSRFQENSWLT